MTTPIHKQTSLLSATAFGVTSIIGSGWLFAAYYAAKYAGPMAYVSWIIGAVFSLLLALMLAEISTLYPVRGLIARLLNVSHNKDIGFVIATSNWLGIMMVIPAEAEGTVQYLSRMYEPIEHLIFHNEQLTLLGILFVFFLIFIYGLINYWGIKYLARVNNAVSVIKIVVPILTGLILLYCGFNPSNFTAYHDTVAPYGIGVAFTAVVTGGIFFSYYGFSTITTFASEIKNPQKNIPIALVSCLVIGLLIYLLLQTAFIGALPHEMVLNGWHSINFTSPLVQLVLLFNLNVWAIILYADAALSPSGTGITYVGAAARILNGMSRDKQIPQFFGKINSEFNAPRGALIFAIVICCLLALLFRSWSEIVIVISILQLITCIAIPVTFIKLRQTEANEARPFKLKYGKSIAYLMFLLVAYIIVQVGIKAMLLALILHLSFFTIYSFTYYKFNLGKIVNAYRSAYSIFTYLIIMTVFTYLNDLKLLNNIGTLAIFAVIGTGLYYLMVNQKNYQTDEEETNA
ncbi:APC family permease [Rickettsiales bacterium LUAb2]